MNNPRLQEPLRGSKFFFTFVFLILIFSLVGARDFIIYNSSNEAQPYFWVNGTTGITYGTFAGTWNGSSDYYLKSNPYAYLNSTTLGEIVNSSYYVPYTGSNANVVLGDYNFSVGTSDFFVNANTGNVGVGTTDPLHKLDIRGVAGIYNAGGDGTLGDILYIGHTTAVTSQKHRIRASTSAGNTLNLLSFETSNGTVGQWNANQFVLRGDGNVGIGTTSPINRLDVNGSLIIGTYAGVNTAPTNGMSMSGNLGVGIVTPTSNGGASTGIIHLNSAATQWSIFHSTNVDTGSAGGNGTIFGTIGVDAYIFNYESGAIKFGTNSAEQMSISSAGLVSMGTASITGASYLLNSKCATGSVLTTDTTTGLISCVVASGLSGIINGSGTTNYIPKFTGTSTIGNSIIYDDGSTVTIGNNAVVTGTSVSWSEGLSVDSANGVWGGIKWRTIGRSGNTGNWHLGYNGVHSGTTDSNLYLYNGAGLYPMVWDYDTGNVGIGTTSPDYKFDVETTSGGSPIVATFGDTSHNMGLFLRATSSYFEIQSALKNDETNEYPLVINPDGGNVGIGTTSPSAELEISSPDATGLIIVPGNDGSEEDASIRLTGQSESVIEGFLINYDNDVGDTYIDNIWNGGTDTNPAIRFRTKTYGTPVNAMTITHGGSVGIGTTAPGIYKLWSNGNTLVGIKEDIADAVTPLNQFNIGVAGQGGLSYSGIFKFYTSSGNGGAYKDKYKLIISASDSSSGESGYLFTLQGDGNVGIGTTAPDTQLEVYKNQARTSMTGTGFGTLHIDGGDTSSYISSITLGQYNNIPISIIGTKTDTAHGTTMFFGTSNSYGSGVTNTAMAIRYDGNVGIGTTDPATKLYISSAGAYPLALDSTQRYKLGFYDSGTPEWWIASESGNLILHENAVGDKVTFYAGGNVNFAGDITVAGGEVYLGSTTNMFSSSNWAGTTGYPAYVYTGSNSRFGFSSTSGYVDVYADGNFYAGIDLNGNNNLVWHAGNDGTGTGLDSDLLDTYHETSFIRARGGIGNANVAVGSSAGWPNDPLGGTYSTSYVGHSGAVLMSNDVGGSASSIGIEATYAGDMYLHTNIDSTSWASYRMWTSGNDGSGSGLDADLLDGQSSAYYATAASLGNYLPLAGGTMNSGSQIGINGGTSYGIGVYSGNRNTATFDTVESAGGDLELNYYQAGDVVIGNGGATHNFHVPVGGLSVGSSDNVASGYIQAYSGFVGSATANIGGTGDAAYMPEGIYSAKYNWLYGGINMGNGALAGVGTGSFSGDITFTNYGVGVVGTYDSTRYQNVFSMGSSYTPADDGTSLDNMYGIAWTHSNIGGESIAGLGHQALFISAGDTRSAIGDGIWTKYGITGATGSFSGTVTAPTFVGALTGNAATATNAYACNADGTCEMIIGSASTYLAAPDFYASSWFRNDGADEGLYNSATGNHFYSDDVNYWALDSDHGLVFRDGHAGATKGYVYWDSTGGFGLLDSSGNWAVNVPPASAGQMIIGGYNGYNAYNSVTGRRLMFGGGDADSQGHYYIGTNMENYGGNYNKLDFVWHTGIRIGAQQQYGGVRIFDSETLGTKLFSVGEGAANVKVGSAGTVNYATSTGDLYVQDSLEVDGTIYGAGTGLTGTASGLSIGGTAAYADMVVSGSTSDLNAVWTDPGSSIPNGLQVFRYGDDATNKPVSVDNANWVMNIFSHPSGGTASYGHQIAGADNGLLYVRTVTNGGFGSWRTMIDSGNIGSQSVSYATTAGTLIGDQTNWASLRTSAVANMLGWKNYGNGHVIFDASQSTSPSGSSVNNANAEVAWTGAYPTLMGWNGYNTYGVRVDSARLADSATNAYACSADGTCEMTIGSATNYLYAANYVQGALFYDTDSSYYVDPSSTSLTHTMGSYYLKNNYGVATDHPYGIYFGSDLSSAYGIYRESGAWSGTYPDLRIAFHTGIKLGANPSYGGVRFYSDYDMSTLVMSVNDAVTGAGSGNVYMAGNVGIGDSTPDYNLDVAGTIGADAGIYSSTIVSGAQISAGVGRYQETEAFEASKSSLGTFTALAIASFDGTYNPRILLKHITSTSQQYLSFDSSFSTTVGYANYVFEKGNLAVGPAGQTPDIYANILSVGTGTEHGIHASSEGAGQWGGAFVNTYGDDVEVDLAGNTYAAVFVGGNVGIGTAAPGYQLELSLNSAAKPTSNVWSVSSDERIKTNITNFTEGLNIIREIRPVNYYYNGLGGMGYNDSEEHIGIIAQELELVAPYMVGTRNGTIGDKNVSDFKTYEGMALPFLLVNSVKELNVNIENLTAYTGEELESLKMNLTKYNSEANSRLEDLETELGELKNKLLIIENITTDVEELNLRVSNLENQTQILINQTAEKKNEVCIIDDSGEEICLTSDEIKMVKEILASGEVNVKEKQKKFLGLFLIEEF